MGLVLAAALEELSLVEGKELEGEDLFTRRTIC